MVKSVGRVKICITRLQMHCLLQCYLIKIIFFLLKHIPFQRWHSRPQMQCCQYFPAQWGKSFIWSFIARDPVHLFLFAQWIRPTHIFCWFPPTLFFSNICLAELGPSFTAEDLWNICEISMKYLWNIWKIFMKYLWNICVMFVKYLWNISDIFVKLYNFFQYVYHRGGSIVQHRKLYS